MWGITSLWLTLLCTVVSEVRKGEREEEEGRKEEGGGREEEGGGGREEGGGRRKDGGEGGVMEEESLT